VVILEGLYFLFKRRRAKRLRGKALSLQSQLHDLKEQEFALRYEEAKRDGQLDRWQENKQP
jgi:hypothetical protein